MPSHDTNSLTHIAIIMMETADGLTLMGFQEIKAMKKGLKTYNL